MPGNDWIQAWDFDTLRIEDVHVSAGGGNATMYADGRHVNIRRTAIEGVIYEGFDLSAETVVLDTVSVVGCLTCAYNNGTAVNLRKFSSGSGPTVTIRGTTLRRMYYGIYMGTVQQPGPFVLRDNLIDSMAYAVTAYTDSAVLESNVVRHPSVYGIQLYPSGTRPASQHFALRRNHVACEANRSGTQYGVYLERTVTNFEGNYVTDCDYGMYLYNSLTSIADISLFGDSIFQLTNTTGQSGVYVLSRWRPTFTGVRVRGTAYGIYIATNDTATIRIDSSAVSGTGAAGIYLQPGTGAAVVGLRNNVTNNLVDGVLNSGTGLRSLTLGRFVGNARWAINSSAVFDAHNNYWGPDGPGPGVVGDSSTAIVGDSLPVLTDSTDVPAPAPPALATFIGPVGPIPAPGAAPVRPLPTVAPATVTGRAAIEAARLRAQQRRQEHQQERQRRHEARRPD
jgi:hypothetical protein